MGQHNDIMDCPRTIFNEKSDNGLLICDNHIPPELLTEIFCRVEPKSLLNCQLVCKRWKILIQSYVWRKKAEMTVNKLFPRHKEIPWQAFYHICKKKPFERNLLRNHSGQNGKKYWQIIFEGGDRWRIEKPPIGVPELPSVPVFEGLQICFATSYKNCTKTQIVDLIAEGFHPYFLDVLQPSITVSEWYSSRWDCPAIYECHARLLGGVDDCTHKQMILDEFRHHDTMEGDRQNQWHFISHVFENYGRGLREINFTHGGMDKAFWAGHYGSKMAGACISVRVPQIQYNHDDELDQFLNE
ncbi:hypothetical protein HN011_000794 [Eciton burchellii]|nr:hypothetical protein HN011_000794 [Eciton burchellii]